MKLEELQAAAMAANEEAERQNSILRQLESEIECDATNLSCSDYMLLQARCTQQERRVEAAIRKACEKQAALDEARSAEAAKLQREMAQRAYDDTLTRSNETQAAITSKRATVQQIQIELQQLQSKSWMLLAELDRAKTVLQGLPNQTKEVIA